MRLSFGTEGIQYVFVDFAQGETLKLTHIPVHSDKGNQPYLEDKKVKKTTFSPS